MACRCQAAGRGAYQQGKVEAATREVADGRGLYQHRFSTTGCGNHRRADMNLLLESGVSGTRSGLYLANRP